MQVTELNILRSIDVRHFIIQWSEVDVSEPMTADHGPLQLIAMQRNIILTTDVLWLQLCRQTTLKWPPAF